VRPWVYNLMYRFGAPWEIGPREELVGLVDSGVLTPEALPPGRALDLGCGSGANSVFLAERGFETVGVDFSRTALEKARRLAGERGVSGRVRFVEGDLTATSIPGAEGPFNLLVDYGTLDDLRGTGGARWLPRQSGSPDPAESSSCGVSIRHRKSCR